MGQMETANTQSQHGMQLVAFLAITVRSVLSRENRLSSRGITVGVGFRSHTHSSLLRSGDTRHG
jgi:3-deoxy-D-arabino-heptulosonate 7-phosphate (DAHP) synthase